MNATFTKDIEEGAHKILSQFENFNDYIRAQVSRINKDITLRQQHCDEEILKLEQLLPQSEVIVRDSIGSVSNNGKKEQTKLESYREHFDALTKHIENTQLYLQRECSSIENKLVDLQTLIVK